MGRGGGHVNLLVTYTDQNIQSRGDCCIFGRWKERSKGESIHRSSFHQIDATLQDIQRLLANVHCPAKHLPLPSSAKRLHLIVLTTIASTRRLSATSIVANFGSLLRVARIDPPVVLLN